MKKFLIIFATLFCTVAIADTITINWDVDNQTYTTTTCEIGGDVILPSVSKRGHIFKGWVAEHFDRGTFTNWVTVPKNNNSYLQDINSNRTPLNGDYIIISDASDYVSSFKSFSSYKVRSTWDVYINNIKLVKRGTTVIEGFTFYYEDNYGLRCNSIMVINDIQYAPGSVYSTYAPYNYGNQDNPITIQVDNSAIKYNGTWKFVYHGNWETDGKNGWKPVEQIVDE